MPGVDTMLSNLAAFEAQKDEVRTEWLEKAGDLVTVNTEVAPEGFVCQSKTRMGWVGWACR